MGRLQKKKTASQKQKKRKKISSLVTQNNDNEKTSKSIVDFSKGTAKKQFSFPKKENKKLWLSSKGKEDNFITKSIQFLREVKIEFKKVTWPTRKHTTGSTVVVIILVLFISFFLGLVDGCLQNVIKIILQ
jgi:preprotein translocase subunit SecE